MYICRKLNNITMETKHTKGEWQPQFIKADINICIGVMTKPINGYSQRICDTILPNSDDEYLKEREEIEANAKLIAAAPELLEALMIAHDIIALRHNERPELITIRKAINKATK